MTNDLSDDNPIASLRARCERVEPLRPPADWREQLRMALTHPVVLRDYRLPSPPLKRAADEVLIRVANRRAACPFSGPPRFGKSAAGDYITEELQREMPRVMVVNLLGTSLHSRSPASFHAHLLQACGGTVAGRRMDTTRLLTGTVNCLTTRAHSMAAEQVVLMIDEFTRMTVDEMTCLADVTNRLHLQDLRATTIIFGPEDVLATRDALKATGRTDLIGRFLSGVRDFNGLRSEEELAEVLRAYDDPDIAEYPPGSGWSLTRFFWPTAYALGLRLEHYHRAAWQAFLDAAKPCKELEIGAEYWSLTIEYVLKSHMNFDITSDPLGSTAWSNAVRHSGFVDSLKVRYFADARFEKRARRTALS